jgi:hypothetical protein
MPLLPVLVLGLLAVAPPAAAQSADASGRWDLMFNTPDGPRPATMTLTKDGERLTGTIAGDPGEFKLEGTQKGAEIALSFTLPRSDGPMVIKMTGTQTGDAIKGPVTFGTSGEGDWTGKRAASNGAGGAAAAGALDVSGDWAFEVAIAGGTGTPSMRFTQSGDKLTGRYTGQLGEAPLAGTVKGDQITFSIDVTVEGNALHIVYSGTATRDSMKGTVSLADFGEGTFTARRK